MSSKDSVEVARFSSRVEADLAVARLEADGIACLLSVDDIGGTYPSLDLTGGVSVRVAAENEARAREILEAPPAE